jgi:hypothetical protein
MKEEIANSTVYRLPRSRLKREHDRLDWIDDHESITVDVDFCNWLAEHYNAPTPKTNEIVAKDHDASICLYRWNVSFACTMTSGDPDMFDGMIGGDSATELVACFETWMTQRQAWHLWAFFRSSIRDDNMVVEIGVGQ